MVSNCISVHREPRLVIMILGIRSWIEMFERGKKEWKLQVRELQRSPCLSKRGADEAKIEGRESTSDWFEREKVEKRRRKAQNWEETDSKTSKINSQLQATRRFASPAFSFLNLWLLFSSRILFIFLSFLPSFLFSFFYPFSFPYFSFLSENIHVDNSSRFWDTFKAVAQIKWRMEQDKFEGAFSPYFPWLIKDRWWLLPCIFFPSLFLSFQFEWVIWVGHSLVKQ